MLSGTNTKGKSIILLTDGIDNMSQTPIEELLDVVSKSGIKVYVVVLVKKRS